MQRRGMALPAVPLAIKLVLKLAVPAMKMGSKLARPAVVYLMRWWPYYVIKFTVMKHIKSIGAWRVYRHARRATVRLVKDQSERDRICTATKTLLRMPTNVQSDVTDSLSELDGFLLKWAMEDAPPQRPRAPAGLSHADIEVEELLREWLTPWTKWHSMAPDISPSIMGMEIVVRDSSGARCLISGKLGGVHSTTSSMFVWDGGMTILGLKVLICQQSGLPISQQRILYRGQVLQVRIMM